MKNPFKSFFSYLFKTLTITVEVTAEDIRLGQRSNCASCPISLAVRRAMSPKVSSVISSAFNITAYYVNTYENYTVPKIAKEFMIAFDAGQQVAPFSFKMEFENIVLSTPLYTT